MTHYVDWDILILKVPTAEHEVSHSKFSDRLVIRAAGMSIVLESGWSESLAQLRQDAQFWLENSRGDVKIILLFSIGRARAGTMVIEKWENRLVPTTHDFHTGGY